MVAGKSSAVAGLASEMGCGAAHTPAAGENPQGDLLREDLDAEVAAFALSAVAPPAARAGRPKGSPNRTTLQLQRLLLQRGYRDPAEFLAALVSLDPRELAWQLAGKPMLVGEKRKEPEFGEALEALKVQRAAAAELLPYFHQKMPLTVHHPGDNARPLVMIFDGPQGGGGAAQVGAMSVHEAVANQIVSASEPKQSYDEGSHDDG